MSMILPDGTDSPPRDRATRLRTLILNGVIAAFHAGDSFEEEADRIAGLIEQSPWLTDLEAGER